MRTKLGPYVRAAILVEIARRSGSSQDEYGLLETVVEEVLNLLQINVPEDPLYEGFDAVMEAGGIDVVEDDLTDHFYRINRSRCSEIVAVEALDPSSYVSKYVLIGRLYLRRAIEAVGEDIDSSDSPPHEVPASDRIVNLHDNSRARDEIVERLDVLIAEVRTSNDEDAKLGDDRERIGAEVEAGRRLLLSPGVRVKALWAVLYPALAFLALAFADSAIGTLASELITALKALLGI